MIEKIQKLFDSYKSPEARQMIDCIWDIVDKSLPVDEVYEILKKSADDTEYLWDKLHKNKCPKCGAEIYEADTEAGHCLACTKCKWIIKA